MDSFDVLDLVLFLGISQGLFLAITIQLVHNRNAAANRVLSIILLIAAFMLLGRVIYFNLSNALLLRIANFADIVIYIFGPLVYVYVRRLTFKEAPAFRLPWYPYAPALFPAIFFSWMLFYTPEEFGLLVKNGTVNLNVIYKTMVGTALFSNFYYCFRSYQVVRLYQKEEKNNLSYVQQVTSFLYVFLLAIGVFLFIWLLSYINSYFDIFNLSFISYDMIWVSIPIFVYVVGFYSLKQPEIFRVSLKKVTNKKVHKGRLEGTVLEKLKEELEHLMVQEKIYLDNNLTLRDLSEKLETSPNNVSWLLNNIHNCSFYDYVNQYRVKTFIEKVQKGEHQRHTLLALSLDSGFNSKSTFNKAFKTEMNDTPTNYIKKLSPS